VKIALIIEAAGVPHTLASTAFAGALMSGLSSIGAEAVVVGLARADDAWEPDALGQCQVSAPWLHAAPPALSDWAEGLRTGVFSDGDTACDIDSTSAWDWYSELLLQRDLLAFAGGTSDGVLMVYPRSSVVMTMAVRVARRMGWKVLTFATEALSNKQIDPASRDLYIRSVVQCSDAVWAVSGYLAEFWKSQGVDDRRVVVSPGLVRESVFHSKGAVDFIPNSAVYVGNLAHREIEYLLDISARVRERVPRYTLTIYGDATPSRHSELEDEIALRSLRGVVRICASVAPTEVGCVLRRAEIALLPRASGQFSDAGFPNKLGEYLASGRPVVVTAVGDIPVHLRDEEHVLLVAPDDSGAFAAAVVRLLQDGALATKLGIAGQQFARDTLSADRVASRVVAWIDGLPSSSPRSAGGPALQLRALRRMARAYGVWARTKRAVVRMLRTLHLKPPAPD